MVFSFICMATANLSCSRGKSYKEYLVESGMKKGHYERRSNKKLNTFFYIGHIHESQDNMSGLCTGRVQNQTIQTIM